MLSQYLPVLAIMILAVIIASSILIISHIINPRVKSKIKQQVYESGLLPQMEARLRYPIRFYVVAMIFILFDVEIIFLYPWAVTFNDFLKFGGFIFWEMLVFLLILLAGYIYLWKRGAFQWE